VNFGHRVASTTGPGLGIVYYFHHQEITRVKQMKTVTILLSFLANEHGIVHLGVYETQFETCYQAEQMALEKAWADYVDTGKAYEISVMECK